MLPEMLKKGLSLEMAGGVGVSLVLNKDDEQGEIAYLALLGLHLSVQHTTMRLKSGCQLKRIQMDYVADNARYPITVQSSQDEYAKQTEKLPPVFEASFVMLFAQIEGGMRAHSSVEFVGGRILPLSVKGDGRFIQDMISFFEPLLAIPAPSSEDGVKPKMELPVWYDEVKVHPLQVHVRISSIGEVLEDLPYVVQTLGVTLANINMTMKIRALLLERAMMTQSQLQNVIRQKIEHHVKHFMLTTGLIRGLGGLEVLGDPIGSLGSVASGVKSLFYEPYKGLVRGPSEFGRGIKTGARAFGSGVVGGLARGAGRATSAAGEGIAMATLDKRYQSRRNKDMSQQPKNLGRGLATGFKRMGDGFVSSFTGLITQPIDVSV
jgi:vacuolar protein sorting-associated protein 13A/C